MPLNVTIKTWNTLHLFHEVNYVFERSYVLEKYDIKRDPMMELLRIEDIVEILKKELKTNTVICLQEVSGDLFEELTRQISVPFSTRKWMMFHRFMWMII